MNESKMMAKRLKRVLLQDKITAYEGLTKALESDIKTLLSYYIKREYRRFGRRELSDKYICKSGQYQRSANSLNDIFIFCHNRSTCEIVYTILTVGVEYEIRRLQNYRKRKLSKSKHYP